MVSAVEEAYGNCDATEVDVAMKYCAVGVVVAPTTPLALAEMSAFDMPARVRVPAESKLEVALPPKYALSKTESCVDEAPAANSWSAVHVLAAERLAPASPPAEIHVPLTEKHPVTTFTPLANVDVADPVCVKFSAERPPENVEVELVPVTFKNPCKVDVPLAAPWIEEVALPPTHNVPNTDWFVDEAPEEKCCRAVQVLAFARSRVRLPLDVMGPPERPLPALTDVTVPSLLLPPPPIKTTLSFTFGTEMIGRSGVPVITTLSPA